MIERQDRRAGKLYDSPACSLLDLYLRAGSVGAEVYEADYGTFRQELLDPESELYRFRPDFFVLATTLA